MSGISISGADAGNYNLTNTTDTTAANITRKDLTVEAHGVNKEYDGDDGGDGDASDKADG